MICQKLVYKVNDKYSICMPPITSEYICVTLPVGSTEVYTPSFVYFSWNSLTTTCNCFLIPSELALCPASTKCAATSTPAFFSFSTSIFANLSGHTASPVPCTTHTGTWYGSFPPVSFSFFVFSNKSSWSLDSSYTPFKNSRASKNATLCASSNFDSSIVSGSSQSEGSSSTRFTS